MTESQLSRRALLGGAGASLLTVGGLVMGNGAEAAATGTQPSTGVVPDVAHPAGAPVATTIASAPVSGVTYAFASMYEFKPFTPSSAFTWGGAGFYTAGTAGPLRAFFDLAPNAVVHDVEWYVLNSSGSTVTASLYQYTAGSGVISSLSADAAVASTGSVTATRVLVPASSAGPFPFGSKLVAGIATPTDGSVQVNGVRIGYTQGPGTVSLLPVGQRVYNSHKTGGTLKKGTTRLITLPASVFAPGMTGVLADITALNPAGAGFLRVYPGNQPAPVTASMTFRSGTITNAVTTGVSSARKIKIYTSEDVDVIVDIVGTLA